MGLISRVSSRTYRKKKKNKMTAKELKQPKPRKPRTKIRKCDLVPNQKRLTAIDSMKNSRLNQQDLIKKALITSASNSKKIVFSDSDDSDQDAKGKNEEENQKII